MFPKRFIISFDRITLYVATKWVLLFTTASIALYLLATLGDIVNNLLRNKLTFTLILEQNLLNSSLILENVLPVSCLLASLFLLNNLKIHSELIAILASGYSLLRMALHIILFALLVALIQFFNVGFWGPHLLSQKKDWLSSTKTDDRAIISHNKIWIKHKSYFGYYRFFEKSTNRMILPNLYFYNENYKASKFISAAYASYGGENTWVFNEAVVIENLDKNQFPVIMNHKELTLPLYESPETIAEFEADLKSLNVVNLYRFLLHIKDTGINLLPYYLQVYNTLAQALLCVIFTLFPFAFPMGISARHQSSGKALLYGLLISILFLALNILFVKIFILMKIPPLFSSLLFPIFSLAYLFKKLSPKVTL